jgi:hypothetical protein
MLKRFAPKGKWWDNVLLFDAVNAGDVIRECRERKIPIHGIDGFFHGEEAPHSIAPYVEHSVDFSSGIAADGNTYDLSLAFVADPTRQAMYFEIVFGEEPA